jgi:hypothetical protein
VFLVVGELELEINHIAGHALQGFVSGLALCTNSEKCLDSSSSNFASTLSNCAPWILLGATMRRLSRLDRSIDLLRARSPASQSSSFLCSACRSRAPFSTSIGLRQSDPSPKSERLRRTIWGTDQPPGFKDPYTGPSAEERAAAREIEESAPNEKAVEERKTKDSKTPAPILDPSYEPAKTWDGLEEVGDLPAPEFYFEGFMPSEAVTDPYEATAALHRGVVEAFTLRQAGRPLSELSNAPIGADYTMDVKISVPRSNPTAPVLDFSKGASEEKILDSLNDGAEDVIEGSTEDSFDRDSMTTNDPVTQDPVAGAFDHLHENNYEEQVASWDSGWLQTSLNEPEIKFAVSRTSRYSSFSNTS